jgi:hypothetical protein
MGFGGLSTQPRLYSNLHSIYWATTSAVKQDQDWIKLCWSRLAAPVAIQRDTASPFRCIVSWATSVHFTHTILLHNLGSPTTVCTTTHTHKDLATTRHKLAVPLGSIPWTSIPNMQRAWPPRPLHAFALRHLTFEWQAKSEYLIKTLQPVSSATDVHIVTHWFGLVLLFHFAPF